ncbi:MAG: hypothetical protein ACRDLF_08305, partial [Solirubrobacteraceae bacterium]
AAALVLSALSCVALGVLLAAVTPPRWLAVGIVLMACADTALVVSELLQHPNEVLNSAHPALGLPRLQAAALGSAAMGYGDLFVAGLFGGLLARGWPPGGRSARDRGSVGQFGIAHARGGDYAGPSAGDASAGDVCAGDGAAKPNATRAAQIYAAGLVAALALAFDLLFFAVDELPATVPVALGLVVVTLAQRRAGRADRLQSRSRMRAEGFEPPRA